MSPSSSELSHKLLFNFPFVLPIEVGNGKSESNLCENSEDVDGIAHYIAVRVWACLSLPAHR
jgi:hypothetical protein